jgi:acetyl-CoA acetyltransferase
VSGSVQNERSACISGAGTSAIGRRLGRTGLDLTVEACLAAITAAGLTPGDIDGVSTYPGRRSDPPGSSPVGVGEIKEALRLQLDWFSGGGETPGQFGAMFNAIAAVATGFARHVLVFRTVCESSAQTGERRAGLIGMSGEPVDGLAQWRVPFGAASTSTAVAMMARRHMHRFGTTREQLAQVPLTCRANAARNPAAVFRTPLTMDDYLGARVIADPLVLFDCDVPVDGCVAVVVSHVDTAPDLRRPPVRIEAVGAGQHGRDSWDQRSDLTTMAASEAGRMLWSRTDLRPADVDTAQLYDGFSYLCLQWLEALGFCEYGESGAFVEGGKRIAHDGPLPLNTDGGQLSAGRLHGYGYLHEACLQLWGIAGDRQLPRAEVAVASAGGGPVGGCLLLTASR